MKAKPKYEILIRNTFERLQGIEHDIGLLESYTTDSSRSPDEDYYMCNAAQNVVGVLREIKEDVAEYIDAMEYVKGNKTGFFVVIQEQKNFTYGDCYYSADVREGYSVEEVKKNYRREIAVWREEEERYNDAGRSYYFRVLEHKFDTEEAARKVARAMSDADIEKIFKTKEAGNEQGQKEGLEGCCEGGCEGCKDELGGAR